MINPFMKDVKHNRIYIVQYDPNVAKKLNFKKNTFGWTDISIYKAKKELKV